VAFFWTKAMYYYQHHIGDYRRDTAHLSLLEHGIYRQLLDLYYISEKPLDANALRLICARDANEVEAAMQILCEFFTLEDGKYYHGRCEEEIVRFHSKSNKAKESAKARWNKNNDLQNANALRTESEGNANHKPLTINHKPNTKQTVEEVIHSQEPTLAASVCLSVKQFGILDVNPSNPLLLKLLEAGATVEEFANAAEQSQVKKFAYVIGIVRGQREQALSTDIAKGSVKPKENLAWRNDDNQIFKKAKELKISTTGKSRFELLAKIDEKRDAQI
jgi:uncharacterized protein YdaU (DUF1376 family)